MLNVTRRFVLASLAAVAAAWPFRSTSPSPADRQVEPPPVGATPRYITIFNRTGRSYEVVPVDEDGHLPPRLRYLEDLPQVRRTLDRFRRSD